MKTRFIVNPHAGGAARALPRVEAFAATLGAEVILTQHALHATELARQALADGCALVVAVGGDGTMNEVAASLVDTPATFGLIPCGSGNGLGRHLGIHGHVAHALEILHIGRPRLIDSGVVDGHPFFTAAGLGFEAEVAARFNRLSGRGFPRYAMAAAGLWHRHRAEDCVIESDGQRLTARAFTLVVANSDQYGNNAMIAPGARVDDGLLDLTVVPSVNVLQALPLLVRLFTGALGGATRVIRRRATRFIVVRSAPGLIHADGETYTAGERVEFTVRPGSLRVLAPVTVKGR